MTEFRRFRKEYTIGDNFARTDDCPVHEVIVVRRGGLLQLAERAGRHPQGTMVLLAQREGPVRGRA